MAGIVQSLADSTSTMVSNVVIWVPKLIAALFLLIIGWYLGKYFGKLVVKILDKAGVDEAIEKTPIKDIVHALGMTVVGFLDALARWFIYIIFIMAAVNVLEIQILSQFLDKVLAYIPSLVMALIIIFVGFIAADFITDLMAKYFAKAKIKYADIITTSFRVLIYFVVFMMALDQLKVDTSIVYTFVTPLAWGLALALGIGLGLGLKEPLSEKISASLGIKRKPKE